MSLAVNINQAVEFSGYGTKRRFLAAVREGIMPQPFDPRRGLWSREAIEAAVRGERTVSPRAGWSTAPEATKMRGHA